MTVALNSGELSPLIQSQISSQVRPALHGQQSFVRVHVLSVRAVSLSHWSRLSPRTVDGLALYPKTEVQTGFPCQSGSTKVDKTFCALQITSELCRTGIPDG